MDALANATTLEAMVISDPCKLGTAGGPAGVDVTDSNPPKVAADVSTLDKENDGAQRARADHRSSALGDIFFGTQPSIQQSRADTHSLSGDTHSPAAAATSTASPLTAASVGARAAEMLPGGTSIPAVKPRQLPVVEAATLGLASLNFAAAPRGCPRGSIAPTQV